MRDLRLPGRLARVLCGLAVLLPSTALAQTTHLVSTEAQLRTALTTSGPNDTVQLQNSITLTADLPTIGRNLTIDGAGFTLSGADQFRGLTVLRTGGSTAPLVNVTVQNLTIANTIAMGGSGGDGLAGGGGGSGMGGGIFIGDGANLTVSNVTVTMSRAAGGNGGVVSGAAGFGGGGGIGGAGGSGGAFSGGGGGFGGAASGGTNGPGAAGIITGGSAGGTGQFPGGANGGGGGAGPLAGGGGHLGGSAATTAGNGGIGGGGGGGGVPGSGGFGGGGGGGTSGGDGGYGAGGGGALPPNAVGFGGGFGGDGAAGGGGGAGLGGAIFVDGNGSLTVSGPLAINGTSVTAGLGSGGGTNGQAHGSAMFLAGVGNIFFNIAGGATAEIQDSIVDELGAGLGDPGLWDLGKGGDGTLLLSGINRYGGSTSIFGGTLQIGNETNIGFGDVRITDATLSITSNGNFSQRLELGGVGTVSVAAGATVSWTGDIGEDPDSTGALRVDGGGRLVLNPASSLYSQGTIVRGGSTLEVNADAALGLGGDIALGDAASTGALSVASGSNFASLRQVTLGAAGGIIDAQAGATVAWNGMISGAGGLTKTGTGTLILNGANTYAGATSVDGGVLRAGAGGIFSSAAAMNVGGGATLELNGFDQSVGSLSGNGAVSLGAAQFTIGASGASSVFSGTISGSGSLVKTGAGVFALTGANSYTGGTLVSQGVLLGTTTSLQGNIVNNAMVVFDQAGAGTYAGAMSGTGALVKNGAGTLVLSGANTYTGGTIVASGTLAGTTASLRGSIVNDATVMFDQAADGTFAGAISGSGALVKAGAGTVTLDQANAHAGGTSVNGGTLVAGATGVFGSGGLDIAPGALVDLAGNSQSLSSIGGSGGLALGSATLTVGDAGGSSVFDGAISGSGSLEKTSDGTLTLGGANTYTGGTTVAGGALVGNSTSLQGHFTNNALVVFDQGFDGTFAGNMSGTGILQKAGSGTLTIAGTHSHTGGTVVTGGTLVGTAANLGGVILNDSNVTFGGSADGTFDGTLIGTGTFGKTGTGTLFLNGAHGHTGAFNVSQGTLALNGTLGSSVFVSPDATFRALGTILGSVNAFGAVVIPSPAASFTMRPAAATSGDALTSAPLFNVGGDLNLNPGSALFMPVGSGPNPTIFVEGAARLNGTTIHFDPLDAGNQRATSFLALAAANGLTMTDTSATSQDPLYLPFLRQDRNMLFVTLLNLGIPLSTSVTDPNASSVGAAIDKFKFGATGDHLTIVRELTALDAAALNDALRQVSGEAHASLLQFGIRDSELTSDIVRRQISARRREILLGAPLGPSWWVQFGGERGRLSNASGDRVGTLDVATGIGGLDYRPSDKWTFGFGGGLVGGDMSLSDLSSSADVRSPRAFGYAGWRPKGFGFRGGGSFARQQSDTQRHIVFQSRLPEELGGGPLGEGINREAIAEEVTLINDQWTEYDDDQQIKTYTIDWLIGVRRASFTRRGFIESGADALSLLMPEQTITLRQTNVLIHLWRREKDFRPFFEFLYRRELTDGETTTELEFPGVPDSRFVVDGLPAPKNIVNARGGATLLTGFGVWTFEYQYRRATGQTTHTGDLRVRF